jgi:acyl-CoA thioester hydrolase
MVVEGVVEFRARYSETDQMGVVHHRHYLVWCEIGRTDLMRDLGASYAEMERRGVYLVISEARLRYLASARYDEPIRVRTTLSKLRSRGVTFAYLVENAESGQTLAKAETDLVCLNESGVPRKLPAETHETLKRAMAAAPKQGTFDALSGV